MHKAFEQASEIMVFLMIATPILLSFLQLYQNMHEMGVRIWS